MNVSLIPNQQYTIIPFWATFIRNSSGTINALFRLGFRWPIVDDGYLEKMIWALDSLGFFTDSDQ